MTYKIVIPVRLNSTRLPRKPMKDIYGKTILDWANEEDKPLYNSLKKLHD